MTDILSRSKGKTHCERCQGKGQYVFSGCIIFCELCHGEDGATSLWKSIEGQIQGVDQSARMEKAKVWESNAEFLGFNAARKFSDVKNTWKKVSL